MRKYKNSGKALKGDRAIERMKGREVSGGGAMEKPSVRMEGRGRKKCQVKLGRKNRGKAFKRG